MCNYSGSTQLPFFVIRCFHCVFFLDTPLPIIERDYIQFWLVWGRVFFIYLPLTYSIRLSALYNLDSRRMGNNLWIHFMYPYCWCTELQTSLLQHMKVTNSYWNVYVHPYFYILEGGETTVLFFFFFFLLTSHNWCCIFSVPVCYIEVK